MGVEPEVARTFRERAVGLIGREAAPPGGLLIERCNCIHTFFMRFAIDATFYDRRGNVVKTVRNIRPWTPFVWGGWRAVRVLETNCAHVAHERRAARHGTSHHCAVSC